MKLFKIVPNPVSGNFSLLYPSSEDGIVIMQVRDLTGRLVHTLKEGVNKGHNVIYIQGLPDWIPGAYFISVKNKKDVRQGKLVEAQ